jgi:hypothetical protein
MDPSPRWFRVVGVLALLWNLLGCLAFVSDLRFTPEQVAALPDAQRALYDARPMWALIATGVAVIGGALGSIGLILGKRWAMVVLVLSLIGIVVQDFGLFVLAGGMSAAGAAGIVLQGLVLVIGIALVMLARRGIATGWVR